MNFKLAWDVLRNGLPKQTETIKHKVSVSRLEMVKAEDPRMIVNEVLHTILTNLMKEAAKRVVITREENPVRATDEFTGSLQLGKKGGVYAVSNG